MSGTSLIFPWRADPERERIRNYLQPRWETTGFELVDGVCPPGPWIKGLAWADGLAKASGDVVGLMDWDCWVPHLIDAELLLDDPAVAWVQAQNLVVRFSSDATEEILSGRLTLEEAACLPDPWEPGEQPRWSNAGVGTLLRREDAEAVPMDPRFVGWGWEDNAWYEALTTMLGPETRLPDSMCFHLWHPPQSSKNAREREENPNWRLWRRYVKARGRPQRMTELLGELDVP